MPPQRRSRTATLLLENFFLVGEGTPMVKQGSWFVVASLLVVEVAGCSHETASPDPTATQRSALLGPINNDFEDGTAQGGIPRGPVTLTNTTEAAFPGAGGLRAALSPSPPRPRGPSPARTA